MTLRAWWDELAGLVLPVACAGCGLDDEPWCVDCRRLLDGPAWRCEARAGRLDLVGEAPLVPVWTLADFRGPVREAVVAWKDHGRHDLTRHLAAALHGAALGLAPRFEGHVLVVPAPSTPAAVRRRGGSLVGELARAVSDGLCAGGARASTRAALTRRGGDQVGLGTRARWANLAGQVRVRAGAHVAGRSVVLVDDVLTTGATVASCHAALERAGATVVGVLTLASTPFPGGRPTGLPGLRAPAGAGGASVT